MLWREQLVSCAQLECFLQFKHVKVLKVNVFLYSRAATISRLVFCFFFTLFFSQNCCGTFHGNGCSLPAGCRSNSAHNTVLGSVCRPSLSNTESNFLADFSPNSLLLRPTLCACFCFCPGAPELWSAKLWKYVCYLITAACCTLLWTTVAQSQLSFPQTGLVSLPASTQRSHCRNSDILFTWSEFIRETVSVRIAFMCPTFP